MNATVDYTSTESANTNRAEKAMTLARYAWRMDLEPEDLLALAPEDGRRFARAAGAHPPSTSMTWHMAAERLEKMRAAARGTVRALGAPPQDLIEDGAPYRRPAEARTSEQDGPSAADEHDERPEPLPDLPIPADAPRGWAELAALGPLPSDVTCHACPRWAVAATFHLYRCAGHPPKPGEWGYALNYTPNEASTCAPARCLCARCEHFTLPHVTSPAVVAERGARR